MYAHTQSMFVINHSACYASHNATSLYACITFC